VLNLKGLNDYINVQHFKLEDIRTATRLLNKGDFVAKIDLQNAYFSIKMTDHSSQLLRFSFDGQNF